MARMRLRDQVARLNEANKQKPYTLNNERMYARDCEQVVRWLAKFIAKEGYAPSYIKLATRHNVARKGLKSYLEDLSSMSPPLVEIGVDGIGWKMTEAGCKSIGFEYIEPILPTNERARVLAMRVAKRMQQRANEPLIREAAEQLFRQSSEQVSE